MIRVLYRFFNPFDKLSVWRNIPLLLFIIVPLLCRITYHLVALTDHESNEFGCKGNDIGVNLTICEGGYSRKIFVTSPSYNQLFHGVASIVLVVSVAILLVLPMITSVYLCFIKVLEPIYVDLNKRITQIIKEEMKE